MKKIKKKSILFPLLGFFGGIAAVIKGITIYSLSSGTFEMSYSYGGDAYTGIQNASAQTANNIQTLAEIARDGLGTLVLFFGIAMICYFGMKISVIRTENKNIETSQMTTPMVAPVANVADTVTTPVQPVVTPVENNNAQAENQPISQ